MADIAEFAKAIVIDNGLSDKITILRGKMEDIELPEKVDIIISEWMGYLLLYESMLDIVIYARDKWLNSGGLILPDRAVINISTIEDGNFKKSKFHFWDNVYGIDMSCIKGSCFAAPMIELVDKRSLNSNISRIFEIDLYKCQKEDLEFSSAYELTIVRNDTVHAVVAWFDIFFDSLENKVNFSTAPYSEDTHWKQTIFYLTNDLFVSKGEVIKGSFALKRNTKNYRALDLKMSVHQNSKNGVKSYNQLFQIL